MMEHYNIGTAKAPHHRRTPVERAHVDHTMELSLLYGADKRPLFSKTPSQANSSYLTDDTEATSFSEDGDHDEGLARHHGAIRIDDFLATDEKDSMSVATVRSSLNDMEEEIIHEGMPREVMVFGDDSTSPYDDNMDIHQRLRIAEMLAQSYKAKMQSTEEMTDNLHEYLKQAQTYAEDVLADRNELLQQVQEIQEDEYLRSDQNVFLKVIMASSLCHYLCGGSPMFLTCSVGLHLLYDAVNAFL